MPDSVPCHLSDNLLPPKEEMRILSGILKPSIFYVGLQCCKRSLPDFFCLNNSFYVLVTHTPTPITQSPLSAFLCPALGPGCLTPLEGITAALCFWFSFGFRQREALARDQGTGEDEVSIFFPASSLFRCCTSGNSWVLPRPQLLLGWVGLVSSLSLALTLPRNTISAPCPFRPSGGDAFHMLKIIANTKL